MSQIIQNIASFPLEKRAPLDSDISSSDIASLIPSDSKPIRVLRDFLNDMGLTHSFPVKSKYIERIQIFRDNINFTWRDDQKHMIDSFLRQEYKYYVLNAVFGSGKTTLLMGIHIHSMISKLYTSDQAMFISFNVCIRNELKQKLRAFGSIKTEVRTFDSIVYEICKIYNYPYLDLPNYEGKRKFVYKICKEIASGEKEKKDLSISPSFIFIDECQDLEHQTFIFFQTFFPSARFIFVGDVFQSIQKEPRESLLWYLLHNEDDEKGEEKGDKEEYEDKKSEFSRYYMKETPRVPDPILKSVKQSLINYYPEFQEEISQWRSSNHQSTDETKVEWHRFYNYSDIFKKIDTFLETYPPEKSMILTFSSAITVKGAMGDLARIRRYICGKGYDVNKNHKKMDHDKLFLSTVNSSKGLERDYIFVVSTFPLERAFMNFSNDLVINLITVGMTRAKKKVLFYVPAYEDKFSRTLDYYFDCPKPNKDKIRDGKTMNELSFGDYMHIEHCVTEIIKQNMIKYDTRIKLREYVKTYESSKVFDQSIAAPKIDTEEERGFVGILIENLITSSWTMRWPVLDDIEKLRNHPMYTHCFKKIESKLKTYTDYIKKNKCDETTQFKGIYYYSQIHVAMYNKLFVELSERTVEYLKTYWKTLRPKAISIRPEESANTKIKIQSNMRMPWITGICDAMICDIKGEDDEKKEEKKNEDITIWEIKASTNVDWKDDALIQAIMYGLMLGKTRCRLVLLNPFRNEKRSYYFDMKKIMHLRELVIDDILTWNLNCYLSKNTKSSRARASELKVTNSLFLSVSKCQYTLYQFMSPTKMDLICNGYISSSSSSSSSEYKDMTKLEKLCAKEEKGDIKEKVMEFLLSSQYRDEKVYVVSEPGSDLSFLDTVNFVNVEEMLGKNVQEMLTELKYEKNEELKYEADFLDTSVKTFVACGYMSKQYRFV